MGRMQARGRYRYHTHAECQRVAYPQRVVYPQRVEYLDHHQRHLLFLSILPCCRCCLCVQGLGVRG